jgi:peptidoglycan biosynthesis protein MviN/MurJ (putative lipid II flippase)
MIVKIIANAMLVPLFGVKGIALSWAVVYAINAQFFWLLLGDSK